MIFAPRGSSAASGIRVIIELVINHTSDQHPWFQRARNAPAGSPERDFLVWRTRTRSSRKRASSFSIRKNPTGPGIPWQAPINWHRFYSTARPQLRQSRRSGRAVERHALLAGNRHRWFPSRCDPLSGGARRHDNENLPETHDILKRIRAALDSSHPGKMLLAEANQWPEDTASISARATNATCLPLPADATMYMAIARKTASPSPTSCARRPRSLTIASGRSSCAITDELTLEMVTDEERDYSGIIYAADRRARINPRHPPAPGPLMERDRRRIELMNALLLSMPGTPVIYYGDEIGMGRHIYLGDRDGVRTPMQWSPTAMAAFPAPIRRGSCCRGHGPALWL